MVKLGSKRSYGIGRSFFQSLIPYLHNSVLSLPVVEAVGHWFHDEPHPSRRRFMAGRYEMYFLIFSQELRKEERRPCKEEKSGVLIVFPGESFQPFIVPEFVISQAKQSILNDIQAMRSVSRDLLSMLAVVKPKRSLKQLYQNRDFLTSAYRKIDKNSPFELSKDEIPQKMQPMAQVESKPFTKEQPEADSDDNFAQAFLSRQIDRILTICKNHTDRSQLNLIYPIYQSLQRNDIDLPSVDAYNIVLKSIRDRSLDSNGTHESIESRLTSLLTVYQDLLSACTRNDTLLPNAETYNTILPCMFDGAIQSIKLGSEPGVTNHRYSAALTKAMDYVQVALNLFLSIKNKEELNVKEYLPQLLECMLVFPHLLTKELCSLIVSYSGLNSDSPGLYRNIIGISKYFVNPETLGMSKKDLYEFVSSVYANFRQQLQYFPSLAVGEFEVYSVMIEAFLSSGNNSVATKFLDQILMDFKVQTLAGNATDFSKVSGLISTYLEELMSSETKKGLIASFDLLVRFRSVSYLPEPSANVFNNMINRFISLYLQLEFDRLNESEVEVQQRLAEEQTAVYGKIWDLYNYVVVRHDFQLEAHGTSIRRSVSCRDSLLSLSLDLGDHVKIARLIKEVFAKDHVIGDWNVSKKVCQYLHNGAVTYGNAYYQNLLWAVVEQQAKQFTQDSSDLNSFLSEHVNFLLLNNDRAFSAMLNSMMVFNAFEKFRLLTDNAYGLMSVSSFLFTQIQERVLSPTDTIKILHYQACLINEFEDPGNHYAKLCEDLQHLKRQASCVFSRLFWTLGSGVQLTRDTLQACSILGLDNTNTVGALTTGNFKIDLSVQLYLNKEAGVQAFITYFNRGYSFTDETWESVCTQNFAMDVLEKEAQFLVAEFVSRIGTSDRAPTHIANLFSLHNDKVSIKVLETLLNEKYSARISSNEILSSDGVLTALSCHVSLSDNRHFLGLVARESSLLYSMNALPCWTATIFQKFNACGMSYVTVDFYKHHIDQIALLNICNSDVVCLISTISDGLLNTLNLEIAGAMFQRLFSGATNNKILLHSDGLLACLFNYYIASGAHNTVLKEFGAIKGRSPELDQLFQFAELLESLEDQHSQCGQVSRSTVIDSEQSLALQILAEPDVLKMRDLYETNSGIVTNKVYFFDLMVSTLTKAASLLSSPAHERVLSRFEAIVKLCRALDLKELGARSLMKIVNFLATTKNDSLLNIMFNKFVVNNTLLSTFNFYFLRVKVASAHESFLLLQEFRSAMKLVEDETNLKAIEQLEHFA